MKRKIGVFTGNRAEYGLLYSIIKKLNMHPDIELQLFVSGAHLDPSFGKTIDLIKDSGFQITDEIKIDLDHDDLFSTAMAIGSGVQEIARSLKKHKPDILVVYADRFEGFSAVIAASQMRIPVAHVEGGDITEGGALDDSVRHAMTKLSHLHFTTNENAKLNVLQMGEENWRVYNVGLPSLDGIYKGEYANEADLVAKWGLDLNKPIIVFTQHSVTTQFDQARPQIEASLEALQLFLKKGAQVFITYPNNDAGGKVIIEKINEFNDGRFDGLKVVPSLGARNYHGLLALARNPNVRIACVGNSSSGIKETPVFGCPTVNIGTRQEGRLRANNVIDVNYNVSEIVDGISKCLFDDSFRKLCSEVNNPYGDGNASNVVVDVLSSVSVDEKLITKKTIFNGK